MTNTELADKRSLATEASGEVVQEPWETLRDIVTPAPFAHNQAAWTVMLRLIGKQCFPLAHSGVGNVVASEREDALNWRALMSSDRLRMMGAAGFVWSDGEPTVNPERQGVHLGLEIWDQHPAKGDESDVEGRKLLLAYVKHVRSSALSTTEPVELQTDREKASKGDRL